MKYSVKTQDQYTLMPWKNGLGVTCELARQSIDGSDSDFLWRVSVADVSEDGPFSPYPEHMRIISTLTGSGIRLDVDGKISPDIGQYDLFSFSGASAVSSTLLDGSIKDFNVIYKPAGCSVRVQWAKVCDKVSFLSQASIALVYAVNPVTVALGEERVSVDLGATFICDNDTRELLAYSVASDNDKTESPCCFIEIFLN